MSRYLVDRIAAQPNIEVLTQTEVSALEGHGRRAGGDALAPARIGPGSTAAASATCFCSSARSRTPTGWRSTASRSTTRASCAPVPTSEAAADRSRPAAAACSRSATFVPGSVKRVAAAVGEGAQVVAALHAFLADAGDRPAFNANPARV